MHDTSATGARPAAPGSRRRRRHRRRTAAPAAGRPAGRSHDARRRWGDGGGGGGQLRTPVATAMGRLKPMSLEKSDPFILGLRGRQGKGLGDHEGMWELRGKYAWMLDLIPSRRSPPPRQRESNSTRRSRQTHRGGERVPFTFTKEATAKPAIDRRRPGGPLGEPKGGNQPTVGGQLPGRGGGGVSPSPSLVRQAAGGIHLLGPGHAPGRGPEVR